MSQGSVVNASGVTASSANGSTPGGAAGGDLTGNYPNPIVSSAANGFVVSGPLYVNGTTTITEARYTGFSGTGGTTLNAATLGGVLHAIVTRSGATADFTDTTDVAGNLISSWYGTQVGFCWVVSFINTSTFVMTIAGGSGVTISGTATIAAGTRRDYLFKITSSSLITASNIGSMTL